MTKAEFIKELSPYPDDMEIMILDGIIMELLDQLAKLNADRVEILEEREKAIRFFRDGDQWCCVYGDFTNLQESPAGWGTTRRESLTHLMQSQDRGKKN